jgi:hypothetical protein
MAPQLLPEKDGYYEWREGPTRGRNRPKVLVHLSKARDGRLHVDGLRIDGAVSASLLRSIPVGRIEAAANAQLHPAGGAAKPGSRPPSAKIPARFRTNPAGGYHDDFYGVVAKAYQGLAGTSARPVAELADANDVPVTTAQRWVREARRRGKLPPGRPGKAG